MLLLLPLVLKPTIPDRSRRHYCIQGKLLGRLKAARERLIQSRAIHLDQLTDNLREERVWRVIEALLSGEPVVERFP